ncbi:MAG: hypothetical protein GY854_34425 [Deltaproteobacteria bacterium]|nr:hypothetical protein [Deltaproteobacteria bacterium]
MMKKTITLLLMIALSSMCLAASCESENNNGDSDKTACEKEDDLIAKAANDYCEPRKDECCYCRCYMESKLYDYQELMNNGNCVCLDDEANDTDTNTDTETETDTADAGVEEMCVDKELQDAENCLQDTDACTFTYVTKVESGCAMSQLE